MLITAVSLGLLSCLASLSLCCFRRRISASTASVRGSKVVGQWSTAWGLTPKCNRRKSYTKYAPNTHCKPSTKEKTLKSTYIRHGHIVTCTWRLLERTPVDMRPWLNFANAIDKLSNVFPKNKNHTVNWHIYVHINKVYFDEFQNNAIKYSTHLQVLAIQSTCITFLPLLLLIQSLSNSLIRIARLDIWSSFKVDLISFCNSKSGVLIK